MQMFASAGRIFCKFVLLGTKTGGLGCNSARGRSLGFGRTVVVAQDFEDLEAELEQKDADSGAGVEPGS